MLFGRWVNVFNETPAEVSTFPPAYSPSGNFFYDYDEPGDRDDYKDPRFPEVMAYHHVSDMNRYIAYLGFQAVDGQMSVHVDDPGMENQAAYTPDEGPITMGITPSPDYPRFHSWATDATILLHEYGHAIVDDIRPALQSPMGLIFHEGYADYLGCTRFNTPINGASLDNLFEGVDLSRNAADYKSFPANLRSDSHEDARIVSSTFWDLRETLGAARTDTLLLGALYYLYIGSPNEINSEAVIDSDDYYQMRFSNLEDVLEVAEQALYGNVYSYRIRQVFAQHGITEYYDDEWEYLVHRDGIRRGPFNTDRESWDCVYQPQGDLDTGWSPDSKYFYLADGSYVEVGMNADPPDIVLVPDVGGPATMELYPGHPTLSSVTGELTVTYEEGVRILEASETHGAIDTDVITDATPGITLSLEEVSAGLYVFSVDNPISPFSTPEYTTSIHVNGPQLPELVSQLNTSGMYPYSWPTNPALAGLLVLGNYPDHPSFYAGAVPPNLYPPGVHAQATLIAVARGGTLPVKFAIANWGHENVASYKIRFMMGGQVLDEITMPPLMPFAVYKISAIIDPDDEIAECIETNNELTSYDSWAQFDPYFGYYNFLVWVVPPGGAQAITPFAFINSTDPPIAADFEVLNDGDPVNPLPVNDVTVSYSSNVPVARWYVGLVDKMTGTAATTSYAFTGLPSGVYELLISGRATDGQFLIAARKGFTVAMTSPIVQIVAGPTGPYYSPVATFHWKTDQPPRMKEFFYRLFPNQPTYTRIPQSAADPFTGLLSATFDNVPNGTRVFVVVGRDIYGNFTNTARRTFIVMGTDVPPEVEIVSLFKYDWQGGVFIDLGGVDWDHPLETPVVLAYLDDSEHDILDVGNAYIVVAATEPVKEYFWRFLEFAPEGGGEGGAAKTPTQDTMDGWVLVRKDPWKRCSTNVIRLADLPDMGEPEEGGGGTNVLLFQVIARDTDGNLQTAPRGLAIIPYWFTPESGE